MVCAVNFRAKSVGRTKIDDNSRVVLDHQALHRIDLSGRKLAQFSSTACRFEASRFEGAEIESASFGAGRAVSEYVDCSFDRARIHFGPGGCARFVRCSFRDVDLRDWYCFAVELVDCAFSGRLRKAVFNGTVPDRERTTAGRERDEFRGNDFSAMDLVDVAFRTGIDLRQQRLPSGSKYVYLPDAANAIQRTRAEIIVWNDLGLRRTAMALIKSLEDEVAGGQRQLLLRPDAYAGVPKEAVDAVFASLRGSAGAPSGP